MRIAINQISLNPSAVARILGAIALFLALASITGQYSKFVLGHGNLNGLVTLFNRRCREEYPYLFLDAPIALHCPTAGNHCRT